jgi:CHASE1-domain containing sensor protein
MRLKRATLSAAAPWITFAAGILIILVVVQALSAAARHADDLRLARVADDLFGRVQQRLDSYFALLRATQAYVETAGTPVSLDAFRSYVERLQLRGHYAGMLGLGYVERLLPGAAAATQNALSARYPRGFHVWPAGGGEFLYPVVYLEPLDERNERVLGFNMYSEATRREAMDRAANSMELTASGIVVLKQDADDTNRQPGFLVFDAVRRPDANGKPFLAGFVYAPFRAGDFFAAAVGGASAGPVSIEAFDGPASAGRVLFSSATADRVRPHYIDRSIAVGGRLWTLRFRPEQAFSTDSTAANLPFVTILGILLSGALAYLSWQQSNGQRAAEREAGLLRAASEDKDLLIKEMRHRIKNVIARVQAIARQTTRGAAGLEDFQQNFDGRLTAMAKTYDLLTESQWSGASLDDVLKSELLSLVGRSEPDYRTSGPTVLLAPREVMALGLAFHELATNALKYGALAQDGGALSIEWDVRETGTARLLRIVWRESFAQPVEVPAKSGFGSRLIDLAIMRELDGKVERDFRPEALQVTIHLRLAPVPPAANSAAA